MSGSRYKHGDEARETVSTRVEPGRKAFLDDKCHERQESLAELLRRLIRYYEHSDRGALRCEHCGEPVEME